MTFTGSLDAVNIVVTPPLTLQDVAEAYKKGLEIIVTQQLGPGERLLRLIVTKIGNYTPTSTRRNLRRNNLIERSLANTDVLTKIEFEVQLEKLCDTGNCQNRETLANELYDEVTNAIDDAIKKGDNTVAGSFQSVFLAVTTSKGQNLLISVTGVKEGKYGG